MFWGLLLGAYGPLNMHSSLSAAPPASSCSAHRLHMVVVSQIFKSLFLAWRKNKDPPQIKTEKVLNDLGYSLRCPVNSFIDVSFTMVVYGENAAGIFPAAILWVANGKNVYSAVSSSYNASIPAVGQGLIDANANPRHLFSMYWLWCICYWIWYFWVDFLLWL